MSVKVQLFILPFSGSKASQFDQFCLALGNDIQTFTMEYAGRGRRSKEPFITDYATFMDDICSFINEHRDPAIPYALLGYSIGGFFAYDLLAKGYLTETPVHMFICGCENNKEPMPPLSQMPEDEFWDRVISFGGVDKRLVEKRKFLRLFSKTMRADFSIAEQHRYLPNDMQIQCHMTILYSEADTPFENIRKWQEVCKKQICFKEFKGDHFFLLENQNEVAQFVKDKLKIERC